MMKKRIAVLVVIVSLIIPTFVVEDGVIAAENSLGETVVSGQDTTMDRASGYFPYNVTSSNPLYAGQVVATKSTLTFKFYCPIAGKARFWVYSDAGYSSLVSYITTPAAGSTGSQLQGIVNVTAGQSYWIKVTTAPSYAAAEGSFNLYY